MQDSAAKFLLGLQDLDEADIIYVYDYCHYTYWLGFVHGLHYKPSENNTGPGDDLVASYTEMMKLPQWKKSDGGLFALYDPHPGFFQGEPPFWPFQATKAMPLDKSEKLKAQSPGL